MLAQNSTNKKLVKAKKKLDKDDNDGAAIFLYKDTENNITQRFAFNLRYYVGAYWDKVKNNTDHRSDGMYEFSVNGTKDLQKSFKYGNINLSKSRVRNNTNSSEFLLVWEQKYSNFTNSTADKVRASARISINDVDDFVKFSVSINDAPIALDKAGKDIVVDWYMLDGFNSSGKFWVDANGLEMIPKEVNKRRDFNYLGNSTISSNYYPITSAIAVRDSNSSKQVLIMNDRAQGASAGLRKGKNIEIMQHRRFQNKTVKANKALDLPLDELDNKGRGV